MSKITTSKIKNSDQKETMDHVSIQSRLDSLIHWLGKNSKVLAFGFGGVLIGCAIYFAWSFYSQKVALSKFEAAFSIEKQITDFTKKSEELKAQDTKALDKKAAKDSALVTPEIPVALVTQAEIETLESKIHAEVIAFIKADPSQGASRNLSLKWAKTLYAKDSFEKALEVLSVIKVGKNNSLEGLSLLSKASTTLQVGKVKEAVTLFKEIVSTKKWTYLHPEARFQLSLALIEDKNEAEAIENLKAIKSEYPDEKKTVEEATKLLRWLQYQKSNAAE